MNLKIILGISLLANALLLAYVAFRPAQPSEGQLPHHAPTALAPAAPAGSAAAESVTNQVVKRFTWESVESADYKEYIKNLRAVGCPDETIRDIIVADVNKLYDAKKKQVRGEPKKFEYWKSGNPFGMVFGSSDTMEKMAALDEEKNAVLRELGIEPDFRSMAAEMVNPLETMFDFLPESKKTEVMKLMKEMQTKMTKNMEGGKQLEAAEIGRIQKEMEEAVKRILTPEEAFDYEMRMSITATTMRMQLAGWDPDEQQFLEVYELRKAFDDEFTPFSRGDENEQERRMREEAEKQLKEQIRQALGADSYAGYERAQDWNFQQIVQALKRADLGAAEANQVYEMKQMAEEQARTLRTNRELSQESRSEALLAIQQETERALQQVLGERGWESYNRGHNVSWLKNMSPPPPAPQEVQAPR
jgi:hypothetical protein